MIEHVVRRGLQHASTMEMFKRTAEDGPKIEMPTWGIVVMVLTFVVFIVFMSMVCFLPFAPLG